MPKICPILCHDTRSWCIWPSLWQMTHCITGVYFGSMWHCCWYGQIYDCLGKHMTRGLLWPCGLFGQIYDTWLTVWPKLWHVADFYLVVYLDKSLTLDQLFGQREPSMMSILFMSFPPLELSASLTCSNEPKAYKGPVFFLLLRVWTFVKSIYCPFSPYCPPLELCVSLKIFQ